MATDARKRAQQIETEHNLETCWLFTQEAAQTAQYLLEICVITGISDRVPDDWMDVAHVTAEHLHEEGARRVDPAYLAFSIAVAAGNNAKAKNLPDPGES